MHSNNLQDIKQNVLDNISIIENKITIPMVEVLTATFFAHNNYDKDENLRDYVFQNKVLDKITKSIYNKFNIYNTYKIFNILKSYLIIEVNDPTKHKNASDREYRFISKKDFYVLNKNEVILSYQDIFNFDYISEFANKLNIDEEAFILSIIDITKKKNNNPDRLAGSRNNFTYKTLGFKKKYINKFFDVIKNRIEVIIDEKNDSDIQAKIKESLTEEEKYETLSFFMWLTENKLKISKSRQEFNSKYENEKSISKTILEDYSKNNGLLKEYNQFLKESKDTPNEAYNVYFDKNESKFVCYVPDYDNTVEESFILTKMDYIIQGFSEKDADKLMHSKVKNISIFHEELKLKWIRLYGKKHMKIERLKTVFEDELSYEELHKTTYYRIFEMMIEKMFDIFNYKYKAQESLKTPYGYIVKPDVVLEHQNKNIILDAKAFQASVNKQKKEIMNMREAIEYFHEKDESKCNKRGFFIHLDNENKISDPISLSNVLGYDFVNISVDFNSFIEGLYEYKKSGKTETLKEIKDHIINALDFNNQQSLF